MTLDQFIKKLVETGALSDKVVIRGDYGDSEIIDIFRDGSGQIIVEGL